MAIGSLLPVFLYIGVCNAWVGERPILESRDGNLVIASAKDRNITLLTSGKSVVNINDINLVDVSENARRAAQVVENWENGYLNDISTQVDRLIKAVEGPHGLQRELNRLKLQVNNTGNSSTYTGDRSLFDSVGRLDTRVRRIDRAVRRMRTKLEKNDCAGNPCQNGGTCIRTYDGVQCLCSSNYEGPFCVQDVDECARLANTDLGCQNGATCRNLPGSYRCDCAPGWHGLHCITKSTACDAQNSHELCGYGTCVPKKGTTLGYTCICEQGWQSEGSDPACRKDVNECAGNHPPCSMNPLVPCINLPGGYACGGCPAGFTGNGYYCTDIDECSVDNGGCSTVPRVQCINTMGSRVCAACPPGYEGNGVTCTFVGACRINNGGCHPLATCVENPGYTNLFVQCNCPVGYRGNGMGPQGCLPGSSDPISPCSTNPCIHGICEPSGAQYRCRCNRGFTGTHCESREQPCTPNPCQNDGVCQLSETGSVTCKCTDNFSGPRCETQRQSCGGLFRNPRGSLTYPADGQMYENRLNCAFVIRTNRSLVLNINFTRFDLESSTDCQNDFLQIHDGTNAAAHSMGRFCGSRLPLEGSFTTTHNAVYLWLRSDRSITHRGFALNWTSVAPSCGGVLYKDHGTISSPGSPGVYPHNRDCFWEINVRPGKRIQFHFFTMMIEEHPTCENDYLEINETAGNRDVQLGLYCNHTHPPPLLSSGSFAKLHFHSDAAGSDMGFQITYSTVEGTPGCGGVFTADHGIITSPGFPANYPANMICDWKIQLPKGERMRLTWMAFDVERSRRCRWDSVEVFSGPDTSSPVVGRHCGRTLPAPGIVDSNVVLIVFTSDWSGQLPGFQLKYETICGGEFHEPSGVIKSPYYPQSYPSSRTCVYEIIQPPGKGIILTMDDLEIEGGYGDSCYFDGLTIYDGDNENSTLLGTLCGGPENLPSQPYYSTHNYMYLKFSTDSSLSNRGFKANYTTVDRRCGGLLKEPTGIIQSHKSGDYYSDNEDCTWTLKAPTGHVVQLTFTTFSLEQGIRCTADYVAIYEGANIESQQMGTRYCGSQKPPTLTTQGESMTIVFHTDNSMTDEGFTAHYLFIDASKVCGGHFFTSTGTITSPGYPEPYPANRECVWVITAPNKQQINLDIEEFNLERLSSCAFDYLEIRNGGYETSPLIGKFCGTDIPRHHKSLTNDLYLKFVSDSSRQLGGFSLKWDSSTFGCGGTLSGYKGEITSPNYPQPYSRLANCVWKIAVAAGSKIRIIIVDFDLEEHGRCRYDYIEITPGIEEHKQPGTRLCGSNHPSFVDVDSNLATIRFRSDYTNSGRGFHIRYETNCVSKVRGFNGVIESPNFPNKYPPSLNCTWTVEAPKGNTVNITFSHFEMEGRASSNSCIFDYLAIQEGSEDAPDTEIKTLCDSGRLPERISSTQHQVFLHFVTDQYFAFDGFRLEWSSIGCGGHLTRPSGVITSPDYPNAYPENIECEWLIEVDYGTSVEFTFLDVNTEKIVGCRYDTIKLYGGGDANAPKLAELCHTDHITTYTSPTNKVFLKFESDFSFAGRGFKAEYKSVALTCGGTFNANEGIIQSAKYPQNYPNNVNCEWLIQVDQNHVVNLTFTDFDIEDTTNCTDDYVKIFDGVTRDAAVLGTHCKSDLPGPIVSTGASMLVVMRSDSLVTSKGFRAQFSKACGARIVTDGSGTLQTTSLLHMVDYGTNCTWIIEAEDAADHVTLNFFHMDLDYSWSWDDDCSSHYVRVYEGDSVNGPIRGTWCSSKTPPPIISTGNALTVHLFSEYGSSDDRFGATYSVLDSACGGEHLSASGTLASPGYPDSYPINAECVWLLKTSPGNRISLTFSAFELESSPNCDRDYLEVREESGVGHLIDTFCNGMPGVIESSKKLWIKFRSDASGTGKGFQAEYAFVHGNELTGMNGEIASPLYPYPWKKDGDTTWRVTVGFGMAIRVEFDEVHLENFGDCSSSVTIYDGYDSEAPVLSTICGLVPPKELIISTSNVAYITFTSNYFREGNWFRLHWYQVPREQKKTGNTVTSFSDCVVEYDMSSSENRTVTISSPGWPDGYADNLDCTWVLLAPPGYHLVIRFFTLSLEETWNCASDYVSIYNGNGLTATLDDSQLLRKSCWRNETYRDTVGKNVMTVKFRSDYYINGTGFRALVRRECGGELSGPNGVIDFNDTMDMHNPHNYHYNCEWNITVRNGRTIEFSFPFFTAETSKVNGGVGCDSNYVLLKNGIGPDSPLLGPGKLCGSVGTTLETLETTGNKLYVKATGYWDKINFKLQYREKGLACGGSFRLTDTDIHTQLSSPNYPNIPPPYSECFWTYLAPPGERLSLHFIERFDLTSSPNCTKEFVEVKDGGTEDSRLIGRYCGETAPSSIPATGNMLYVHFYTEIPDPKNGFKATITTGDVCGGIIRGKTGIVRSPNYPGTYPIDQECVWWIIGPVDHTVKLQFTDINLPGMGRCVNTDFVTISEQVPSNDSSDAVGLMAVSQLGRYCGSTIPDPVDTSSNEAVVGFQSDNRTRISYRGFSLNFTASKDECGGSLTGVSGEFQSIGYPNPYKRSRQCEWLIEVPEGSQVMLEILDLDMTAEDHERRSGSYLSFSNDKRFKSRIMVLEQLPYPDKIYSTSNIMKIRFWFSSSRRGLKARYTAVAPAPCGGRVNDASGVLLPPPMPYNATSFFCQWKLRAPESMIDRRNRTGATLTLTISGSIGNYLRTNKFCQYNMKYISINDGTQQIDAVCGNITGEPYIIRSPAPLNIIDVVNGTIKGPMNFNLQYNWTACGGILTGPSHTIKPPVTSVYPKSCVWHAKYDDPGAVISMSFNRINLGSCDKGYVIVRNGGRMSPQTDKFCGNIMPRNITSSSNQLWIEYWATAPPGDFEIQLNTLAGSCGGVYRGSNKEITSPGFPKQYPNNAECTWEITADPGYTVGLVFVDRFSMETSDDCAKDFVQTFDWIYDSHGNGAWKNGTKYCGRNTPPMINATSDRMKVLFRSNDVIQGDGFRAKWEQTCGGMFEARSTVQYIATPSYPEYYLPKTVCNYTIDAPPNKEIWIEFLDFDVEDNGRGDCKYDNVTITSHVYYDRKDVFCGNKLPRIINSMKKVNILFVTDPYVQKRGFRFKYFLNDCGGEITEPTEISPPSTKIGEYFGRLNCTWVIRAPQGKSVVLRFEKFHLEWSSRCMYDQLVAVEGETLKGKNIITLCGNVSDPLPPPLKSEGNVMTVMFRSDGSNEYGGMKATILFTNSVANGCGGKIALQTSTPFRTQSAAKYDPLDDCHWTVTAELGKNVRLRINHIDLKNSTNTTRTDGSCSGDFLEVRDGGPFSDIIGQYCGNVSPHPITSTTNVLWIRLFTDSTLEGEGVSATLEPFESPCGKLSWRIDNETKIMESPGYPGDFPVGLQCRWDFKNTDSFALLRLHFESLDMEDTENCDGDHLEITDEVGKYIIQNFGDDFIFNGKRSRPRSWPIGRYHRTAVYKYCGQASGFDYHSNSNEIHVTLRSTAINSQKPRKFKFDVAQASCNRNYTSEQGRILHQTIGECWTTITAPAGRTISLYFKKFRFFDHGNCSTNYLKVHDGDFETPPVQTLCGLVEPSPIFSTGNVISIHAKASNRLGYGNERYDILYTTTDQGRGCGGKFFNYEGIFTSPMYPHNYRNVSNCVWEISVPRGFQVVLEFSLFDLGTADICPTDYLQVKEMKDGGRDETYCPGQTPAPFRATTNTVNVIYVSSVNNGGTGWQIRFLALQDSDSLDIRSPWRHYGRLID